VISQIPGPPGEPEDARDDPTTGDPDEKDRRTRNGDRSEHGRAAGRAGAG
jgi:hypothetical protein